MYIHVGGAKNVSFSIMVDKCLRRKVFIPLNWCISFPCFNVVSCSDTVSNNCCRKFSSLMIDSGVLSIVHNSSSSKSVVGAFSRSVSLITDSDLNIGGRTQREE